MKVLVTGGAGFIGSHVVDSFLAAGHDVVVVDDLSSGRESNLNPDARFYKVDIRDEALDEIIAKEKPDIIDHHAAQMDVRKSVADALFDADVNVKGTINLLESARRHNVRKVIYISTGGAVYGEPEYLPCDENHPINPICQYGVSKHTVEHYLFVYKHLYGMDYTVLRYPNVYGARQNPHGEAGVVAIFAGKMLANEPITIFGTGEQERDFVYVTECARANVLAIDKGSGKVYNIASGQGVTINLIFDELKGITGYGPNVNYGPAKAGETFKIYLDGRRAAQDLAWQPVISLREGLTQTVDYFREFEKAARQL
jgi:UDP-glucose 4-epimerase